MLDLIFNMDLILIINSLIIKSLWNGFIWKALF